VNRLVEHNVPILFECELFLCSTHALQVLHKTDREELLYVVTGEFIPRLLFPGHPGFPIIFNARIPTNWISHFLASDGIYKPKTARLSSETASRLVPKSQVVVWYYWLLLLHDSDGIVGMPWAHGARLLF